MFELQFHYRSAHGVEEHLKLLLQRILRRRGVERTLNPADRLSKEEIDRQYIERLRKLLPYVRRTAGPASPSS